MKEFLNINDICNLLNISDKKARRLLAYGNIKGKKIGNKWVTTKQNVINYIDSWAIKTLLSFYIDHI